MIKFFRRIRQKLLSENKFSKYLLYAIGEIILVVIGILIALQINNWNAERRDRDLESKILFEISSNLKSDIDQLDNRIVFNNKFKIRIENILSHLENKTEITDSLRNDYSGMFGHRVFRPITAGYENLKSQGLNLIKNDSLRKAISQLYDSDYYFNTENVKEAVSPLKEFQNQQYQNKIETIIPYEIAQPINLEQLQNDKVFFNTIKTNIYLLDWINRRYEDVKSSNQVLQSLIYEELKK